MKKSKTPMSSSRDRFHQGLERVPVQVRAGISHMRRLRLSDCPIAGTGAGSTAFPAVEHGEARRCFGVPLKACKLRYDADSINILPKTQVWHVSVHLSLNLPSNKQEMLSRAYSSRPISGGFQC